MSESADTDRPHFDGMFASAEISQVSRVRIDNDFECQLVECTDQGRCDTVFECADFTG